MTQDANAQDVQDEPGMSRLDAFNTLRDALAAYKTFLADESDMDTVGALLEVLAATDEAFQQLGGRSLFGDAPPFTARACRACGCTEDRACDEGCYWTAPDLCSRCYQRIPAVLDALPMATCPSCSGTGHHQRATFGGLPLKCESCSGLGAVPAYLVQSEPRELCGACGGGHLRTARLSDGAIADEICPRCGGNGSVVRPRRSCPTCGGHGNVRMQRGEELETERCWDCAGSGTVEL